VIYPWQKRRDRTFSWGYNHFAPVHARYIVDNEKLKLLRVDGATRTKAGLLDNSLLPPWKYVRYDENPPAFLRALVPINRTLKVNPFYFGVLRRDEEIFDTYVKLFEKLATHRTHPIIVCPTKSICNFENSISGAEPYFLKSQIEKYIRESQMFNKAPRNHLSALGNQLRADELFSLLIGEDQPIFEFLKIDKTLNPDYFGPSTSSPLFTYSQVSVNILGSEVATFVTHAVDDPDWKWNQDLDFQKEKIFGMLWVSEDEKLFFIPTNFLLSDGEPVYVEFKMDNRFFQVPIGMVMASNPVIENIMLNIKGKERCFSDGKASWKFCFVGSELRIMNVEATGTIEDLHIVVGEDRKKMLSGQRPGGLGRYLQDAKELVTLNRKKTVELRPTLSTVTRLRSKEGNFIDLTKLKRKEGTVDLVVTRADNMSYRFPIVFFKVSPAKVSFFAPPTQHPSECWKVRQTNA